MTLTEHPDPTTERTIKHAEAYISAHSDGGITNEAGGIMRTLISRLMEHAEQDSEPAEPVQLDVDEPVGLVEADWPDPDIVPDPTAAQIEAAAKAIDPGAFEQQLTRWNTGRLSERRARAEVVALDALRAAHDAAH